MGSLPRRHALIASLTAVGLALALLVPTAFAAPKTKIVFDRTAPAEGATLGLGSYTWGFTYNRTPTQTAAGNPLCSVSPVGGSVDPTPCSTTGPTRYKAGSKDMVTWQGPAVCQAPTNYTLTITLQLTDGGTASATRAFTAFDLNYGACGV